MALLLPYARPSNPPAPAPNGGKALTNGQPRSTGIDDRLDNPLRIAEYLVIPEPHDPPPVSLQMRRSQTIPQAVHMLGAVELDHQPRAPAGKVGDIGVDPKLPREARPEPSQHLPKRALSMGGVVPQLSRKTGQACGVGHPVVISEERATPNPSTKAWRGG